MKKQEATISSRQTMASILQNRMNYDFAAKGVVSMASFVIENQTKKGEK